MTERLRTGELARAAGVSNDTIRHYERKGVIHAATREANGYRSFPSEALRRLALVRNALALGFTLDELAEILRSRSNGEPPCRKVRSLAAGKLDAIDREIAALLKLRGAIAETLEDWDERLTRVVEGEPAHLLESLDERSNER